MIKKDYTKYPRKSDNVKKTNPFKGLYLIYEEQFSRRLWNWLQKKPQILRMQTASDLNRPAVQALIKFLHYEFPKIIKLKKNKNEFNKIKQMIGHMIRMIMEDETVGYEHSAYNVSCGDKTGLFNKASKYKDKKKLYLKNNF